MVKVKRFKNGKPEWDVSISAIVIGIILIAILAILGVDGGQLIGRVLRP